MRKIWIAGLLFFLVLGIQDCTRQNEEQSLREQKVVQKIDERELQLKMPPFQGLPSATVGGRNRQGKTIVLMQPVSSTNPLNVVKDLDLSGENPYSIEVKK